MRILASGDHHFGQHTKRWNECIKVHSWMADLVREEQIDLFVSGGDVYEGPSTPIDREAASDCWLLPIADVCPVVIAKGNHDQSRDCQLLGKLRANHPIIVEERAGVHQIAGVTLGVMAWPERGEILASQIRLEGGGGQVGHLSQAELERKYGPEHVENVVRESLRAVLRGLGSEMARLSDGGHKTILLGHFMVDGSMTSTGQPLIGSPMNVSLNELGLVGAQLGILAHVHLTQSWDISGAPHHYTGSPFRTDYGQLEPKGVLIAEFDDDTGRLLSTRFVESPCARLEHVELRWDAGGFADSDGKQWFPELAMGDLSNTEIRLRYHVPADQREAAERKASEISDALKRSGAVSVKVEPRVIPTLRARAPEVAKAYAVRDKLLAYWQTIDFTPGDRLDSLLEKATELEEQVRLESKGDSSANA